MLKKRNAIEWRVLRADSLLPVAVAWDELARRLGAGPCLSSAVVSIAIEIFADAPVVLAVGSRDGVTVAATVLCKSGLGQWMTFQPSQLPLGAWLMDRSLAWEPTIRSLAERLPGIAAICSVSQLDPLVVSRPSATSRLRDDDYIRTASIIVHGDFESYWARRGKNLRQNSRKQRKKLAEQGLVPELEIVRDQERIADAVEVFAKLESSSWKQITGSAVTAGGDQERFYSKLLTDRARHQRGFVALWRLGADVAAADLCIHDGDQLVILKTAYDASFNGISPGQLMHEDLFRLVFERYEFRRVEFLGRVMDWHSRWTDDVRTLFHVTYFRSALLMGLRDILGRDRSADSHTAAADTVPD